MPSDTGYTPDSLIHGGNDLLGHAAEQRAAAAALRDRSAEAAAGAIKGNAGTALAVKFAESADKQDAAANRSEEKAQGAIDAAHQVTSNEESAEQNIHSIPV